MRQFKYKPDIESFVYTSSPDKARKFFGASPDSPAREVKIGLYAVKCGRSADQDGPTKRTMPFGEVIVMK